MHGERKVWIKIFFMYEASKKYLKISQKKNGNLLLLFTVFSLIDSNLKENTIALD